MPSINPATFFEDGLGTKMLESATLKFNDLFRLSETLLPISESCMLSLSAASELENAERGGEVARLEGGGASFGLRFFESLRRIFFFGGCSSDTF